ncbi:MAG: hypothetical protein ACK5JG_12325 [Pseudomonadota bacterium]|jgi:hypothetical protein|nr:hypothetical protein [Rubrivivax sp.]MCA3257474.1 hypothetical protein [Rubrivivax sp.]MCZ8029851.1 hypothetical protein [Rubrivivax sp.]
MLGWYFVIYPQRILVAGMKLEDSARLASWKTGLGGTKWIEQLCNLGQAVDLGGNGYPNRYVVPAATLSHVLQQGVPSRTSPPVIGDDYFLPPNWTGEAKIDIERLKSLPPEVLLAVEAWDQS